MRSVNRSYNIELARHGLPARYLRP